MNPDKAYLYILRLLARRQKTEKQIKDKLQEKFDEDTVRATIVRLKEESLINDAQFAKSFVRARESLKPKGKRMLFWELRQKGVEESLISKILDKEYNKDKELKLAQKAIEKKLETYKNLPPKKIRQKISQFLLRRGFNWETIRGVLEKCAL